MVLSQGVLHDRIKLRNYGLTPVTGSIDFEFDADFVDLFEVRGTQRLQRGHRQPPAVNGREVSLIYTGLDGAERATRVGFEAETIALSGRTRRTSRFELPPHAEKQIGFSIRCENGVARAPIAFPDAMQTVADALERRRANGCDILTSNQQFNDWLRRSTSDLSMMITDTRYGEYPYAGVPWFSTPFGRDGLITAFQCLWMNPSIARGVLSFLAATQAIERRSDSRCAARQGAARDAVRRNGRARRGAVRAVLRQPRRHTALRHAGRVLSGAHGRPRVHRAHLAARSRARSTGSSRDGDLDADGFIEYARQSPTGLVHQGWKDSHDSIFARQRRAGRRADRALRDPGLSSTQPGTARRRFRRRSVTPGARPNTSRRPRPCARTSTSAFWNEPMGTYAIALDGAQAPMRRARLERRAHVCSRASRCRIAPARSRGR